MIPAAVARLKMSETVAGDTHTALATCLAESPPPSLSLNISFTLRMDNLLFPITSDPPFA